ncbi:MAG: TasA family protein [Dehalococcoidia bacterium]|jgi:hypothetical protein
MLRRILVGLVAIGVLASFMGMGGFSLFTATTDNDSNAFTSGSVEISTSPASAFLTMSNMAPGDSVTAKLTVSNDGTLQMRYAMTTATTDADSLHLDQALTLVIRELGTDCTTFDGAQVYSGTLKAAFIGDPTPGGDPGDRTLDAHTPEDLCFKVTLPSDAIGPMSASTTATFTFDAEQTTNNP